MKLREEDITKTISDKKILKVPMSAISTKNINPRKCGLIPSNIDALIETKGEFPEIYLGLYQNELIIIDGWHRFTSNQRNDLKEINAFIMKFDDIEKMKVEAFKANINHGIKLSDMDIALSLYEFYIEKIKTDPLLSINKLSKELEVNERRGKFLFYAAVVLKEILQEIPKEIKNISNYEEYAVLINKTEQIGQITESFKEKFKTFYQKYNELPKYELRLAIKDFLEGKDYYEEKLKAESLVDEMKQKDQEEKVEKIEKEDLIDRNMHVSNEVNPIIKELAEKFEENNEEKTTEETPKFDTKQTVQQIEEEIEQIDEKLDKNIAKPENLISLNKPIKSIKEILEKIKLLCYKKKSIISKEDIIELNEIMDNLDELIKDCSNAI